MERPRYARALMSAMLLTALGAAGCASSGGGNAATANGASSSAPTSTPSSSPPSSPPTTSSSNTGTIPTGQQLQAALLTASDLGGNFTAITPGSDGEGGGNGGGTVSASTNTGTSTSSPSTAATTSGCPALDALVDGSGGTSGAGPDVIGQEAEFSAGTTGPFLDEELLAGPVEEINTEFAQMHDALASCKSWTISSGQVALTFAFSPITFTPGADTTAVRLDGTYQGQEINGYIVYEQFPSVLLGYAYFQFGGGSSQVAYADFTQAVAKVEHVLGIGS